MNTLNPFQEAATGISSNTGQPTKSGRVVTSLEGIDAKPMSWFVEEGQGLMLQLIAHGEIEFLVFNDVLLIPIAEIDPYMPPGHEWDE